MWFQVSTTKQLQMVTDITRAEIQTRDGRDMHVINSTNIVFRCTWMYYGLYMLHMFIHMIVSDMSRVESLLTSSHKAAWYQSAHVG